MGYECYSVVVGSTILSTLVGRLALTQLYKVVPQAVDAAPLEARVGILHGCCGDVACPLLSWASYAHSYL